ncbi:hypothetical protein TREMEDRAFT_64346 [Tremella mesenterica DSM 1558]|uniref:uncharacterized protein n=1 Tax=Tremella mesenterica (strain ATCC 24925 / CBS 8224 / DSM 1558 / NBRC 9311 / NRRL Y-6157 / RJB 2259-6 / UBC 559-6) TaxID=578456 RepID=UPI0003F48F7C|nr:uncharacterized protein TREMEDRAFT_64346 [Tremella mesenterica DSM 1558]EIW67754.1 hypothetical protein TREMEDRAFT_64346 [Tremella mesenterica DSM 1558]
MTSSIKAKNASMSNSTLGSTFSNASLDLEFLESSIWLFIPQIPQDDQEADALAKFRSACLGEELQPSIARLPDTLQIYVPEAEDLIDTVSKMMKFPCIINSGEEFSSRIRTYLAEAGIDTSEGDPQGRDLILSITGTGDNCFSLHLCKGEQILLQYQRLMKGGQKELQDLSARISVTHIFDQTAAKEVTSTQNPESTAKPSHPSEDTQLISKQKQPPLEIVQDHMYVPEAGQTQILSPESRLQISSIDLKHSPQEDKVCLQREGVLEKTKLSSVKMLYGIPDSWYEEAEPIPLDLNLQIDETSSSVSLNDAAGSLVEETSGTVSSPPTEETVDEETDDKEGNGYEEEAQRKLPGDVGEQNRGGRRAEKSGKDTILSVPILTISRELNDQYLGVPSRLPADDPRLIPSLQRR